MRLGRPFPGAGAGLVPVFPWGRSGGALGRYRETPAGVSAWRLMGEGLLWGRSLPIGGWSGRDRRPRGGRIKASSHSTGDGALVGEGRALIEVPHHPGSSGSQYSRKDVWGRSPFPFDAGSPMEELAARIEGAALGLSFQPGERLWFKGTRLAASAGGPHPSGRCLVPHSLRRVGSPSGTLQQAGSSARSSPGGRLPGRGQLRRCDFFLAGAEPGGEPAPGT